MEKKNQPFRFRTNMNCSGCVAAVTPYLDKAAGMDRWEVDTAHKDKILTIHSAGITKETIIAIVEKAGYTIADLPD